MSLRHVLLATLLCGAASVLACDSGNERETGPDGASDAGDGGCEVIRIGCGFDAVVSRVFRAGVVRIEAPGLFLNADVDGGVSCTRSLTSLTDNLINTAICSDDSQDDDDALDLSLVLSFDEFSTEGAPGSFGPADCEQPCPGSALVCEANPEIEPSAMTLTVSEGDDCEQTLGSQTVSAAAGEDGCFTGVVDDGELVLDLTAITIPLVQATMVGSFINSPALGIDYGAILGFIKLDDAQTTTLPDSLPPPIGGLPLVDLLRGPSCDPSDVESVILTGDAEATQGFVFVMKMDMHGVPFDTNAGDEARLSSSLEQPLLAEETGDL